MTNTKQSFLYIGVIALILAIMYLFGAEASRTEASVSVSNEYQATSTAANNYLGAFTASRMLKRGGSTLGSVVITGANTGIINFYDATTSDVNLRVGNQATSTLLIASFPASAAAGVYTFDVITRWGIYVDITGAAATSTITYR